jgi:hypothetical protein
MTIILGILLLLFVVASFHSLYVNFSVSSLVTQLAGFTGLAFAFQKALSNSSLRAYFWFQRIRIWWFSDLVTRWWFSAGFDGDYVPAIIYELRDFLRDKKRFKFDVVVDYFNDREVQVVIDKTLTLRVSFDPSTISPSGRDHISIISKSLEVSYGHARKKIETQIVPVMLALRNFLNPESGSYDLNVDFPDRNPFFAVYVANLKPEQIGDFRVVLHLEAFSPSLQAETVEISRQSLHLTALSTDSFKKLALDFILLSADTKMLAGARAGA